jgi:hypothetical protein
VCFERKRENENLNSAQVQSLPSLLLHIFYSL